MLSSEYNQKIGNQLGQLNQRFVASIQEPSMEMLMPAGQNTSEKYREGLTPLYDNQDLTGSGLFDMISKKMLGSKVYDHQHGRGYSGKGWFKDLTGVGQEQDCVEKKPKKTKKPKKSEDLQGDGLISSIAGIFGLGEQEDEKPIIRANANFRSGAGKKSSELKGDGLISSLAGMLGLGEEKEKKKKTKSKRKTSGRTSPWIEHVKNYAKTHNVTYKQAMSLASKTYTKK